MVFAAVVGGVAQHPPGSDFVRGRDRPDPISPASVRTGGHTMKARQRRISRQPPRSCAGGTAEGGWLIAVASVVDVRVRKRRKWLKTRMVV